MKESKRHSDPQPRGRSAGRSPDREQAPRRSGPAPSGMRRAPRASEPLAPRPVPGDPAPSLPAEPAPARARPAVHLAALWGRDGATFDLLVRSRFRRRPASEVEPARLSGPMPGDTLLPEADVVLTRAVDISGGPDEVWPWLAQLFRGGGVYGWSRLDLPECQPANYLLGRLPPLRAGDRAGNLLALAQADAGVGVVWRSLGPLSVAETRFDGLTLAYRLTPDRAGAEPLAQDRGLPGARTRLTVRLRALTTQRDPRLLRRAVQMLDFALLAHQLPRLRRLIETLPERRASGYSNRGQVARHQAVEFVAARGKPPQ